MYNVSNALKFVSLCICLAVFSGMDMRTPGAVSSADLKDFKPVSLKEGQGIFEATVVEDLDAQGNPKTVYNIKEAAFSGETTVNGIRREDSAQVFPLDLSKIKEIIIVNPSFESQRYKEGTKSVRFILAKIVMDNDEVIEQALLPERLSFGGINLRTGVRADWPEISAVKKISINRSQSTESAVKDVADTFNQVKASHKVVKKIR